MCATTTQKTLYEQHVEVTIQIRHEPLWSVCEMFVWPRAMFIFIWLKHVRIRIRIRIRIRMKCNRDLSIGTIWQNIWTWPLPWLQSFQKEPYSRPIDRETGKYTENDCAVRHSVEWMQTYEIERTNEWMNEKKGYINRKLPLYYTAIDRSIDRPTENMIRDNQNQI